MRNRQAEIDQAMQFTEMFLNPVAMLIMGLIMGVFLGFLVSLKCSREKTTHVTSSDRILSGVNVASLAPEATKAMQRVS